MWEWHTWYEAIGVVTAVAGAIVALHYKIIRPLARRAHNFLAILPSLEMIAKELSPNGGRSIKDCVARMDASIALIECRDRIIQDYVDVGIYECAPDGKCLFANRKLCELFGLSAERMLGNGWLIAIVDEDRHEVWKVWMEATRNGIPYACTYGVVNQMTSKRFTVRTEAKAIKDSDGIVLAYHGTIWLDEPKDEVA